MRPGRFSPLPSRPSTKHLRHRQRYDATWDRLSRLIRRREPLCRQCGRPGEEVDHIVPLVRGGSKYDPANLQTLCRECHRAKTQWERLMDASKVGQFAITPNSPPRDWVPITPDDNADLPSVAMALMNRNLAIGITVVVRTIDGGTTDRTVVIPAGQVLSGFFTRVKSTGTTVGAQLSGAV